MYSWIWRHLPGNLPLRILQALLLAGMVSALLLFVVFPWLEPRLPANPITGTSTIGQ